MVEKREPWTKEDAIYWPIFVLFIIWVFAIVIQFLMGQYFGGSPGFLETIAVISWIATLAWGGIASLVWFSKNAKW